MTDPLSTNLQLFSQRLKSIRKQSGLTQAEIAFALGMDDGNYRKVENGKTNPTLKTIVSVCSVLGISLHEFFDESFDL